MVERGFHEFSFEESPNHLMHISNLETFEALRERGFSFNYQKITDPNKIKLETAFMEFLVNSMDRF